MLPRSAEVQRGELIMSQNPPKRLFLGSSVREFELNYCLLTTGSAPLPVRVAEGKNVVVSSQGRNAVYLVQEDGHETSGVWMSPDEARRLKKWLQDHGY